MVWRWAGGSMGAVAVTRLRFAVVPVYWYSGQVTNDMGKYLMVSVPWKTKFSPPKKFMVTTCNCGISVVDFLAQTPSSWRRHWYSKDVIIRGVPWNYQRFESEALIHTRNIGENFPDLHNGRESDKHPDREWDRRETETAGENMKKFPEPEETKNYA
ncbi:hypothetical protein B0H13DRAFT_1909603 [Mycena leptocephala]|nr:hypothetical protein B0H13DRAFT_1909603 [Mycena leptocephala]